MTHRDPYTPALLTIVMPAHNAEKYIDTTLDSFLSQTFTAWKLIVIDDCSNDDTWNLVRKWMQKDTRITGLQNEANLRVAKTMNKGIALVDTPYFARVDSDDVLLPDHFEKTIKFLAQNKDIDLCGAQVITIDGQGNFRRKWNYETDPEWIRISSIYACPFLQSSVVMRTTVIQSVGGYRPEMELIEDYELWIRILQKYRAANLADYTIQYRIHDSNMSETNKGTILRMLESMYHSNSDTYPIDIKFLGLHARMEVGEWTNLNAQEWKDLTTWFGELLIINKSLAKYDEDLYQTVVEKYFTNAYLKIASQNDGFLRYKSLLKAVMFSPKNVYDIYRRKKENITPATSA